MSFDELMLWLVSAMSLTAVVFLLWTLGALVRKSGQTGFTMESESGRRLSPMPPRDPGSA